MLEIGQQTGRQTSRMVDPGLINSISNNVNMLRKPHFDERQFHVDQDQSGYYISINEIEILKNLTINNCPWMISNDEYYDVTDNNTRYIKILPGSWYRTGYTNNAANGLQLSPNASDHDSRFTLRNAYSAVDGKDPYWRCQVGDGESFFIGVQLRSNNPDIAPSGTDAQFPTFLSFRTIAGLSLSGSSFTSTCSAPWHPNRIIGYVNNRDAVLRWKQYIEGDIYDTIEPWTMISQLSISSHQIAAGNLINPYSQSTFSPYVCIDESSHIWFRPECPGYYKISGRYEVYYPGNSAVNFFLPVSLGLYGYDGAVKPVCPVDKETMFSIYVSSHSGVASVPDITIQTGPQWKQLYVEHFVDSNNVQDTTSDSTLTFYICNGLYNAGGIAETIYCTSSEILIERMHYTPVCP